MRDTQEQQLQHQNMMHATRMQPQGADGMLVQEGWALPESTGLVSSASVPPMKSNRLSSPFAMPAHHPQQPSNPQPGAKQSKKVKIKLKQPDSSSAAQGVLSHSSLPASFTEAGAAMSQAVQAPAGATMSHGNQALSHANLVNSSAAEHRQTVSSFAAASLPRNGTKFHPHFCLGLVFRVLCYCVMLLSASTWVMRALLALGEPLSPASELHAAYDLSISAAIIRPNKTELSHIYQRRSVERHHCPLLVVCFSHKNVQ